MIIAEKSFLIFYQDYSIKTIKYDKLLYLQLNKLESKSKLKERKISGKISNLQSTQLGLGKENFQTYL